MVFSNPVFVSLFQLSVVFGREFSNISVMFHYFSCWWCSAGGSLILYYVSLFQSSVVFSREFSNPVFVSLFQLSVVFGLKFSNPV